MVATNDLAGRLTALGYEGLFLRLDSTDLDRVWRALGAPERLRELVVDPGADAEARVLAAEVLFERQPGFPPDDLKPVLATLYARALSTAKIANPWGLPGESDGPAGQHLLLLGQAAVEPLVALLNENRRVHYIGSKEATVGNSYAYRVKDLAAFYLSRLLGLPYAVHELPAERDTEIESLRRAIAARPKGGAS